MRVATLELRNFRNYARQRVAFEPGLTLMVGENAQGKSNLSEALYALSSTRSVRTHREQEVVRWGETTARIAATLLSETGRWEVELAWQIEPRFAKRARINRQEVRRLSELFSLCRMVLFSAADLALVTGAPAERRRYLDYLLCKVSPLYLDALQHYQQVLRQRNEWLKRGGASGLRPVLDEQLYAWGRTLTMERASLLDTLRQEAARYYAELTASPQPFALTYRPSLDGTRDASQMTDRAAEELRRGTSLVGPHRDDLAIELEGEPLRAFGSRGQLRCAALALRLAEGEVMRSRTRESVIYLLDDCMSELDPPRQGYLWTHLQGKTQAIVTGTPDMLAHRPDAPMAIYRVAAGQVTPWS